MSHRNREEIHCFELRLHHRIVLRHRSCSLQAPPVRKRRQHGQPPKERFQPFPRGRSTGRSRRMSTSLTTRSMGTACMLMSRNWQRSPADTEMREINGGAASLECHPGPSRRIGPRKSSRQIGVPTETVTIPDPQDLPKSWEISVSANGKTLKLESSQPIIDFAELRDVPAG